MNYGKKHIVIPKDEYEVLMNKTIPSLSQAASLPLINPVKYDMKKSEINMNNVLNRADIPYDEKIRQFTEELNNLKSRYESLTRPKPMEVVIKNQSSSPPLTSHSPQLSSPSTFLLSPTLQQRKIVDDDVIKQNAIKSLPKTSKQNGVMILEHLKNHPDIIKWNKNGQIIYKNSTIPDSNLIDLLAGVVTNKKLSPSTSNPLMSRSIFLKALSDANVPESWIRNKESKKLMHSYKEAMNENPYQSPKVVKKFDWTPSK